jgi:hypothetical protein
MRIELPPLVASLLPHLPDPGSTWLVGGAVRDVLLGREVRDVDLAVPAEALNLARAWAGVLDAAFVPLDATRGCARLVLHDSGTVIDVAELRAPSLEADLAARDFTINALAVPLAPPHEVIDPTGGVADLRARRIRCPGSEVLDDDPLRGLRAVRFAGELGFEIEEATRRWIRGRAASLGAVAAERIRDELLRALASPHPSSVAVELHSLGLLAALFPDRATLDLEPLRRWIAVEQALGIEDDVPHARSLRQRLATPLAEAGTPGALLRLASLLHFTEPEGFRDALTALRLGSGTVRWGGRLMGGVLWLEGKGAALDDLQVYRFYRLTEDAGPEAALLARSRETISDATLQVLLSAYFDHHAERVDPPTLVTGDDLVASGLPPGPRIGSLLESIREAQAAGRVRTRDEALDLVRAATNEDPPDA